MTTNKFFTKQNVLNLLFESVLIILSVLLALFLNEYRSQLKDRDLNHKALKTVVSEVEKNLEKVKDWYPYHQTVLNNFVHAAGSDSVKSALRQQGAITYWSLMPRGVIRSVINKSAWQAFKSSTVFSGTDYEVMMGLSNLYDVQEIGVETTLRILMDILMSREALKAEELDYTLVLLQNGFRELVEQEKYLIINYETVLKQIKGETNDLVPPLKGE